MSEFYEVILVLLGRDVDSDFWYVDEGEKEVNRLLYEEYGIEDFHGLEKLLENLTGFIEVGKSPLTGMTYKGFANKDTWLYKQEIVCPDPHGASADSENK
jgi:hypothetical protein